MIIIQAILLPTQLRRQPEIKTSQAKPVRYARKGMKAAKAAATPFGFEAVHAPALDRQAQPSKKGSAHETEKIVR